MPIGMIGTPALAATKAVPSKSSSMTGPVHRVPSGNITSGLPPVTMSVQACSASRSALPRCTGKAPSIDTNRPSGFDFQIESLPMYRIGRVVTRAASAKSTLLRCTGASTKAPVVGTFSAPMIVTRPSTLATSRISPRTMA